MSFNESPGPAVVEQKRPTECEYTILSLSRCTNMQGQLLGIILQHEKPELEERKSELLKREEDFKVRDSNTHAS
eukprot:1650155-Amphidinium_carterae.1